jgi:hypothetical protein
MEKFMNKETELIQGKRWLNNLVRGIKANYALTLNFEDTMIDLKDDYKDREKAQRIIGHGLLRLCKKAGTNRKPADLLRVVIIERGHTTRQLHAHIALRLDGYDEAQAHKLVFDCWAATNGASKAIDRFNCQRIYGNGWEGYLGKTMTHEGFNAYDDKNSRLV